MTLFADRDTMVTYCTNIHPGEGWTEIFANVRRHVPKVKEAVCPNGAFPIGLRLSNQASLELGPREADEFLGWCGENGCFVRTVNGFPYGTFHGVPIKEEVYLPDWRDPARLEYTVRLAALLARWLPDGMRGSISTVPLGYRATLAGAEWEARALGNLRKAVEELDRVRQRTGKEILLALEPEPGCALETTNDVVAFFDALPFPTELRELLGVCYDCCHQAIAFEEPAGSLARLAEAGVRIGHVQVSSALRCRGSVLPRLAGFSEPCYLHQTVGRLDDGNLLRCSDLPAALALGREDVAEWRIHFHVPVFLGELPLCETTRPFLEEVLPRFPADLPLEVETYTWTVLPPELRTADVTDSIVREIRWVEAHRERKA